MRGRGQLLHFTDPDVIGSVLGSHEKPRCGKKVDEDNASVKSQQDQTRKKNRQALQAGGWIDEALSKLERVPDSSRQRPESHRAARTHKIGRGASCPRL
jgi:hypothetical protein